MKVTKYNDGNEPDETYFTRDYQGFYMEALVVIVPYNGTIRFYRCKRCAALTDCPGEHEHWHRAILWQPEV